MKLIIGLGNPGEKYAMTRHNVGFMVIDYLVGEWPRALETMMLGKEKTALYESIEFQRASEGGEFERIRCVKPETFMNLSGEAVKRCVSYSGSEFDISNDLWVIHDDVDLELGRIKIGKNSSAAGHNGVKNIIHHLGTKNFIRFRIGIRPPEGMKEPTDVFVLKKFTKDERVVLRGVITDVFNAIETCLDKGVEVGRNLTHNT